LSRPAISFSAAATSRRMRAALELARAGNDRDRQVIADLTGPTVTTGAAEMFAFKGISLFRRGPCRSAPSGFNPVQALNIRVAWPIISPTKNEGRHQQLIDDVADESGRPLRSWWHRAAIHSGSAMNAVHFFSRSASDSQARKYVSSRLDSPTSVVKKPACLMPCFSQSFSVIVSKRFSSGRQPARQTTIRAHFVDHRLHSPCIIVLGLSLVSRERLVATIYAFVKGRRRMPSDQPRLHQPPPE